MRSGEKNILKSTALITILVLLFTIMPFKVFADSGTIDQVKETIKQYYVQDVSDEILNKPTIEEIVKGLNDPYSSYFSKQQYDEFMGAVNMNFVGIGVHVETVKDGMLISSVVKGSPAEEAGIVAKDITIEADGHKLGGLSAEQAVSYVKGTEGTKVHLKIKRGNKVIEMDVERRKIELPTVEGKLIDKHIGYISLMTFGENTGEEFYNEFKKLKGSKADSYIVDLRGNPGGYLEVALDVAGYFMDRDVVITEKDKSGERNYEYSIPHAIKIDKPVVLLTDGGSASASEALTGALKDHKKVYIIGNKTYGKGCMQNIFPLKDGGSLKLTVANFYTPNGTQIQKVGIKPYLDTKKLDAVYAARLLLSKRSLPKDKTGIVKISDNGFNLTMDILKARTKEFWSSYKTIFQDVKNHGKIEIGNKNKWTSININYNKTPWKIFYPNYSGGKGINLKTDKKLTFSFNESINTKTLNSKSVELINSSSGERQAISMSLKQGKTIEITPKKSLKKGTGYYLVINNTVKNTKGKNIKSGIVATVTKN